MQQQHLQHREGAAQSDIQHRERIRAAAERSRENRGVAGGIGLHGCLRHANTEHQPRCAAHELKRQAAAALTVQVRMFRRCGCARWRAPVRLTRCAPAARRDRLAAKAVDVFRGRVLRAMGAGICVMLIVTTWRVGGDAFARLTPSTCIAGLGVAHPTPHAVPSAGWLGAWTTALPLPSVGELRGWFTCYAAFAGAALNFAIATWLALRAVSNGLLHAGSVFLAALTPCFLPVALDLLHFVARWWPWAGAWAMLHLVAIALAPAVTGSQWIAKAEAAHEQLHNPSAGEEELWQALRNSAHHTEDSPVGLGWNDTAVLAVLLGASVAMASGVWRAQWGQAT